MSRSSPDPAGMRLREHDRLVSLAVADGLVGTYFVEPLALDPPTSLVELKNGGCMPGGAPRRIELFTDVICAIELPMSVPGWT